MRRPLVLLLSLILLPALARADGQHYYATTIAGADIAIPMAQTGITFHKITWTITGGTAGVCTVALDSSSDGSSWTPGGVISGQSCTSPGNAAIVNSNVNFVRINVTFFTVSGGTPILTTTWDGYVNNPASGVFTSVTTSAIFDPVQNLQVLGLSNPASSVDYLTLAGGTTGAGVTVGSAGETNVPIRLSPAGNSPIVVNIGTPSTPTMQASGSASNTGDIWAVASHCWDSTANIVSCFKSVGLTVNNASGIGWTANNNAQTGTVDGSISRLGPGVTGFGSGTSTQTSNGYYKSSQILQVTASNFTTSAITLTTITGLSWAEPTNYGGNWSFSCQILYSQATGTVANLWGVQTATTVPTNLAAWGTVYTGNAGAMTQGSVTAVSSTASQTVVTATPGATGTAYQAELHGTFEGTSTASPTVLNIQVASGSASDTITIYRGSKCTVW